MALPESSVSVACRSVAEFVRESFRAQGFTPRVLIGTPAEAVTDASSSEHRINLFFHRFEPSLVGPDVLPGQSWYIRVHCLVTAFAVVEDSVSAGENDLRLLGEVIRFFHEKPLMDAVDDQGEVIRIQVLFQPLSLDDINRLWSTQKDVTYRPSVAYELALVPVVPRTRAVEGPRVGSVVTRVRTRGGPGGPGREWTPPVAFLRVDVEREDWAPEICLVRDGECLRSIAFEVGSPELVSFQPEVLVVGEPGTSVRLRWDVWDRQQGWRTVDSGVDVSVAIHEADPRQLPASSRAQVALPFTTQPGQAVLYAVRRYRRVADGPQGAELEVRGNPLLVTLHGGAP
ncbi:hypothetical protein CYFUS_004465 [Cystobacter fuscus]|uniref:Pvc16 N-terminal domain-containing protein n=1 Tax=Cystobacter fuscus TaxID=43 RepID=A0A250J782_9BACT|nr:Pvc16 family protein [Cystobacter fuscus]ATB39026.1 hypothetical protein CYFUS_004465 [Cystobacter fuscus]